MFWLFYALQIHFLYKLMNETDSIINSSNGSSNTKDKPVAVKIINFEKNKAVFIEQKKEQRFKKIQTAFKQALKMDNKKSKTTKQGKSGKREK